MVLVLEEFRWSDVLIEKEYRCEFGGIFVLVGIISEVELRICFKNQKKGIMQIDSNYQEVVRCGLCRDCFKDDQELSRHWSQCPRRLIGGQAVRRADGRASRRSRAFHVRGSSTDMSPVGRVGGRGARGGGSSDFRPWPSMRFLTSELERMVSAILGWRIRYSRDRLQWMVDTAFPDVPSDMRRGLMRACLEPGIQSEVVSTDSRSMRSTDGAVELSGGRGETEMVVQPSEENPDSLDLGDEVWERLLRDGLSD